MTKGKARDKYSFFFYTLFSRCKYTCGLWCLTPTGTFQFTPRTIRTAIYHFEKARFAKLVPANRGYAYVYYNPPHTHRKKSILSSAFFYISFLECSHSHTRVLIYTTKKEFQARSRVEAVQCIDISLNHSP